MTSHTEQPRTQQVNRVSKRSTKFVQAKKNNNSNHLTKQKTIINSYIMQYQ